MTEVSWRATTESSCATAKAPIQTRVFRMQDPGIEIGCMERVTNSSTLYSKSYYLMTLLLLKVGKLTFQDGSIYEGEFKENVFEGIGKYQWPDGSYYIGEWKDNRYVGVGCYIIVLY